MEERFLEELSEFFPKMKFSLINMELPSPIFGCERGKLSKREERKLNCLGALQYQKLNMRNTIKDS
jgi:hypothetical protein